MIEHVRTVGFKGFDLDEPVPNKVIYCGKNKSGKSTRAGAIAIALFGHIPFSTAGKRPGDILDSFGKDSLITAVKIDGTEFARKFSRNTKGGVSQSVQIDKKKASSENFAIHLDRAGSPKIADVAEFMKQSEAKKIDTLFELFPNDTLVDVDTEIEEAKEDVSRLEVKKKGVVGTVNRLSESKVKMEIPSGSIAEIQAEIKNIDSQVEDLEKQIKESEIEQARIEGEQKAKEQIQDNSVSKDEAKNLIGSMSPSEGHTQQITPEPDDSYLLNLPPDNQNTGESQKLIPENKTHMSISRIIDALTSVGCNTCAALIVAKQELKKYKGAV